MSHSLCESTYAGESEKVLSTIIILILNWVRHASAKVTVPNHINQSTMALPHIIMTKMEI